jgi:hypothetical protein
MYMHRRIAVVLTGLAATSLLAAGAASAAPVDSPHHKPHPLTAKEKAGLRVADDVLGSLFGGVERTLDRGL